MNKYKCPQCEGKKEYITEVNKIQYPVKCTYCDGTGKVPKQAIIKKLLKG